MLGSANEVVPRAVEVPPGYIRAMEGAAGAVRVPPSLFRLMSSGWRRRMPPWPDCRAGRNACIPKFGQVRTYVRSATRDLILDRCHARSDRYAILTAIFPANTALVRAEATYELVLEANMVVSPTSPPWSLSPGMRPAELLRWLITAGLAPASAGGRRHCLIAPSRPGKASAMYRASHWPRNAWYCGAK